jgi:hypothetical protein
MFKIKYLLLTTFWLFLLLKPLPVHAQNIFGLHLTQTSDIDKIDNVINSSGGDWGWATLTIRTDQLNPEDWQNFFNKCRQKHIIPLIRLATKTESDYWAKPTKQDIDNFANFLNSLNWPTTNQHIILFNEINRSGEWGDLADPIQYVDIAIYASQTFKQKNPNFYIITAGLDLSAPLKPPEFISADNFYQQILNYQPNFFDHIDAISSHSYPNPAFIGKPTDFGRFSIRGYQWEIEYLKNLGVNKDLPIFITETGWPHREGSTVNNSFYTSDTSVQFLIQAINLWSKDERIQAVTPFIYNYPFEPFEHFSWLDSQENIYPAYNTIIQLPKEKNQPDQITKFEIDKIKLPFIILPNHHYQAKVFLKNLGQSIWGQNEKIFCLQPQSTQNVQLNQVCTNPDIITQPGEIQQIGFSFTLAKDPKPPKTFIGWQGIEDSFEITPIIQTLEVYRPKTHTIEKIKNLIRKLPF